MQNKDVSRGKKIFLNIVLAVLILLTSFLLIGIVYIWNSIGDSVQKIDRIETNNNNNNDNQETTQDNEDTDTGGASKDVLRQPINILLLGVDSNQTDVGRSDTIMVVRLHPETKKATIVSLPRDTYTEIVGKNYKDKVNHSMIYGIPTTMASVENFFDIHIDYYATIDFEGFKKAIDTLGGVEINVDKRMKYTDRAGNLYIDLYPGLQKLDGEQALGFARFRHDSMGDIGRIQRQQQVIKAVIDKTIDWRSSKHIFKLLDIVSDHFKTDIPPADLIRILTTYRNATGEDIDSYKVDGKNERFGPQNLWYYVVTEQERQRLHEVLTKD